MIKRILMIGAMTFALSCGSAFADGIECEITKDYSEGNVELNIKSEAGDTISVGIFPASVELSGIWDNIPEENFKMSGDIKIGDPGDMVVYAGYCIADGEGVARLTAGIDVTGNNNLYVVSSKTGEQKVYPFSFTNEADYTALIEQLNAQISANNKDEFYNQLSVNATALDFVSDITDKVDIRKVSDILFEHKNGQPFDAADYSENCAAYTLCELIAALNAGGIADNAVDGLSRLIENDDELKKFCGKYITSDTQGEFLTSRMEQLDIEDTEELLLRLKQALVLTVIKYPDGYVNIEPVIEAYKSILPDITSKPAKTQVYVNLAGKEFGAIEEFVKEYNRLVEKYNSDTSSSGGGGGGGGSGSSSSVTTSTSTGAWKPAEIYMPFEDIDTSAWVYEAVSTLYNAGIITGKSETRFSPETSITREEFAKLVICTIGENAEAADAGFLDVVSDAWYSGYVNKAAAIGIISGIGDGLFGTGRNITRQDMAVMLCRALEYKGIALQQAEPGFTDSDAIADYAKASVAALSNAGIINGVGDGSFNPTGNATRGEAAQMIFGIYKLLK